MSTNSPPPGGSWISLTRSVASWISALERAGLRHLLSGGGWSLFVQVGSKAAILLSVAVGARLLGPTQFGVFAAFQAVVLLGIGLWDLGFNTMASRREAADEFTSAEMVGSVLRGRVLLLPLFILTVVIGARLIGGSPGPSETLGFCLLAASGLAYGLSSIAIYSLTARLQFRSAAIANLSGRIALSVGVAIVYITKPAQAFIALSAAILLGELLTLAIGVAVNRAGALSLDNVRLSVANRPFAADFRKAAPLAATGIMILVYNRLDVLFVSTLSSSDQAGIYAPASRFQDALMILPATAIAGLLPVASMRFGPRRDHSAVTRSLLLTIGLSLCVTIPGTLVAILLTPELIRFALGNEFSSSVAPTRILIFTLPFIAVASPTMAALIAIDKAHSSTIMIGIGFAVAVVGMLLLVPKHGAMGGAVASFAREPAIALTSLLLYRRANQHGAGSPPNQQQSRMPAR